MKSKTFNLLSLSILALVMFMGAVSAATLAEWELTTNGTAINVDTNTNAGTFASSGVVDFDFHSTNGAFAEDWPTGADPLDTSKYFEVTIAPKTDYTLTITDVNFDYSASIAGPADFEAQYSKQASFGAPTSLVIKDDVSTTELTSSNSGLSIEVSSGETLTIRWFGYGFTTGTNEFRVKDLAILGTATTTDFEFCEYDDGVSANPGKLDVNIKDITVEKGFGNDEEWLLLDEVEVEVEIENKGNYKVDDISVEWGIADEDMVEWVIDMDEEDEFNLKDDDEEKLIITFRIDDDDLDMDLDELDGSYRLYVRATGTIDDSDSPDDGDDTCASDYEAVSIEIESDFVILADIEFNELVSCGADVQVTADVWNIGDNDQEDVYVLIYNKDLGINEKIDIGDVDAFENEKLDTLIKIPSDAEEKWHTLKFTVYDEDDDIYENDYDDDKAEFTASIRVEGSCSAESQALVSASLESGGKAGQELVVSATITNMGDKLATYSLNVAGYADWASSSELDQSTVLLNAGESKDVLITFNVKKDALGEKTFNIEVLSENELVVTQPVSVLIEKSGFGFTGGIISEGNWYLWGIGALNFILVIIIIIVALRVIRK